jgi:hypothetical protein
MYLDCRPLKFDNLIFVPNGVGRPYFAVGLPTKIETKGEADMYFVESGIRACGNFRVRPMPLTSGLSEGSPVVFIVWG